jgi:hypothetical protein
MTLVDQIIIPAISSPAEQGLTVLNESSILIKYGNG